MKSVIVLLVVLFAGRTAFAQQQAVKYQYKGSYELAIELKDASLNTKLVFVEILGKNYVLSNEASISEISAQEDIAAYLVENNLLKPISGNNKLKFNTEIVDQSGVKSTFKITIPKEKLNDNLIETTTLFNRKRVDVDLKELLYFCGNHPNTKYDKTHSASDFKEIKEKTDKYGCEKWE